MKKCHRCNGEMRINDYENGDFYSEDGKMPCPHCEGEGVIVDDKGEENGRRNTNACILYY
tara:strand:+ start:45 stop:224 length:180 start_codon:yes stop_codon:yes gene_type:complete